MRECNTIPVVLTALDVVEYIAASPGAVKMADIQKNLGIPQATCYRMITSLVLHGWLEKRPGNEYELAGKIKEIASKLGFRMDKYAQLQPLLNSIANQMRLSVKLSVLDGTEFVNVGTATPHNCRIAFSQPGFRAPLKEVASVSTVFLAEMSLQEQKQILSGVAFLHFLDMYKFYALNGCAYQPGSSADGAAYPLDTLSFPVKNENRLAGVLSFMAEPGALEAHAGALAEKVRPKLTLLAEYL